MTATELNAGKAIRVRSTFVIPVEPSTTFRDRPDTWGSEAVLRIAGRGRFHFRFVGPGGMARREYQGPELPGPYAYANAQVAVIDNYGGSGAEASRLRAAGMEMDADLGDYVEFRGFTFEILPAPNRNIRLRLVDRELDVDRIKPGDILYGRVVVREVTGEREAGRQVVLGQWMNELGETPGPVGRCVVSADAEIHRPGRWTS